MVEPGTGSGMTAFGRHGRRGVFFRETAPFVTGGPQKSHIQGRKAGHFLQSVWSSISEIGPKWSKRQLTKILFYGTGTRAAGRCKYDHYTVTHASQCRATALKCHGSLLLGYRDHDSRENAHVPVVPCSSQIFTTGDFKRGGSTPETGAHPMPVRGMARLVLRAGLVAITPFPGSSSTFHKKLQFYENHPGTI
eukprot:1222352-Rhodomonas_salina.1